MKHFSPPFRFPLKVLSALFSYLSFFPPVRSLFPSFFASSENSRPRPPIGPPPFSIPSPPVPGAARLFIPFQSILWFSYEPREGQVCLPPLNSK